MDDGLDQRVAALERAVTDGEYDFTALSEGAEAIERLDAVEKQVAELSDRVAELEAATQALRGYVGNIRAVNEDVEQRADAALARAETLAQTVDDIHSAEHHGEWTDRTVKSEQQAAMDKSGRQRTNTQGEMEREYGETEREHCESCGHPRERTQSQTTEGGDVSVSATGEADVQPHPRDTQGDNPAADSGEKAIPTDGGPPEQPEETLVPETTETGTLQRIRQLL